MTLPRCLVAGVDASPGRWPPWTSPSRSPTAWTRGWSWSTPSACWRRAATGPVRIWPRSSRTPDSEVGAGDVRGRHGVRGRASARRPPTDKEREAAELLVVGSRGVSGAGAASRIDQRGRDHHRPDPGARHPLTLWPAAPPGRRRAGRRPRPGRPGPRRRRPPPRPERQALRQSRGRALRRRRRPAAPATGRAHGRGRAPDRCRASGCRPDRRAHELGDPVGLHDANGAGLGSAAHRVDDDCEIDAGPRVQESGRLAIAEPDLDRRAEATPDPAEATPHHARHHPSDAVVAPPRVADPDHDGAGGHVRSTVRSRKWVAHEMHGS